LLKLVGWEIIKIENFLILQPDADGDTILPGSEGSIFPQVTKVAQQAEKLKFVVKVPQESSSSTRILCLLSSR
jgi:hypothetical protein